MNSTLKTVLFWAVILGSALVLWQVVKNANSGQKVVEINFSQLMTDVDQGKPSKARSCKEALEEVGIALPEDVDCQLWRCAGEARSCAGAWAVLPCAAPP